MKLTPVVKRLLNVVLGGGFFLILIMVERLVRQRVGISHLLINPRMIYGQLNIPYPIGMVLGVLVVSGIIKAKQVKLSYPAGILIVCGVIINLYDWIKFAAIGDYLNIGQLFFNIADLYIIVGLVLLVNEILPKEQIDI